MDKASEAARDTVRNRSEGLCERCGCILTRHRAGKPDRLTDRSIHHRQPRRCGGKDSVINLVNLCIGCHRYIHECEDDVVGDGWIVIGRHPRNTPFRGHRGWLLPRPDGTVTLLDFEGGRAVDLPRTPAYHTRRRSARRQRHRSSP